MHITIHQTSALQSALAALEITGNHSAADLTCYQNLIPLLLRPLRLCVAPEKLRKTRIFLLKVTHVPLVGAIYIFEGLSDYFSGVTKQTGSGVLSLGGPSEGTVGTLKRTSPLRSANSRPLIGTNHSHASLPQNGRFTRTSRPATALNATSYDSQNELKALILKLTAQVEDLRVVVSEQQISRRPAE